MKRTNLVLDEDLLGEALKASGQSTYSGAVNKALEEYCRLHRLKGIFSYEGSGIWEGNLSEMRRDYDSSKSNVANVSAKKTTIKKSHHK